MRSIIILFLILIYSTVLFPDGVQPEGLGTEEDPYQIEILDNLLWVSTNSSSWDNHFIQTADIDASDTQNWNYNRGIFPIGHSNIPFTGRFDGQNYFINSLHCDWPIPEDELGHNIGLFGYIDNGANIENMRLENVFVSGILAVGGVIGYCRNSTVNNCFSSGSVDGFQYIGGLIGKVFFNSAVSNSWATNYVNGSLCVGGLLGMSENNGIISNCFSTGSASGNERIGGLVGSNSNFSTINNSYSKGSVNGDDFVGGLVGKNNNSTISNSFWDIETSEQATSDGGTGKTTAEMKNVATYTDISTVGLDTPWDFVGNPYDDIGNEDYWDIDDEINNGYPYLANPVTEIDEEEIYVIPEIAELKDNYPNPFNPTTTIEFSIQNDSEIDLSIYNIKGQKIKSLANNEFTEGSHSIIWNGDNESGQPVSTGIYYYKLSVDGKNEAVKKCLLLK